MHSKMGLKKIIVLQLNLLFSIEDVYNKKKIKAWNRGKNGRVLNNETALSRAP